MGTHLGILGIRQSVIFLGDNVQQDFLGLIVDRPDLIRSFKHHMLEIMRNTCVWGIFSSGFYDYGSEYLRLAMVLIQPYRQIIT